MKIVIKHSLLGVNDVLIHRVRKRQYFYFIFITSLSVFFAICFGLPLLFYENNHDDLKVGLGLITYVVLIADLLITSIRFQNKALVETKHVILFPISNREILDYQLLLLLFDLKSFIYISISLVVFIYFLLQAAIIKAIISLFVWLLFLLTTSVWMLLLITFVSKVVVNKRDNIIIIYFILLYSMLSINLLRKYDLFYHMPISGYSSNCLFGIATGDHLLLFSNVIILVLLLVLGKVFLRFVYPR